MKLSRNKIRKLYKQRNQSFKRGKNNNNQPKRFKKQYTFRQKISDTNSFENNHNDNHTIHSLSTLLNKTVKTYIPKFELSRLIDKYKNIRRIRKNVMRGGVAEADQSDEVIESTSFNKPDDSKVNKLLQALLTGQEYNYVVTQPINGASEFKLVSVQYGKIETPEEKPPGPAAAGSNTPPVSTGNGDASTNTKSSKKEEFIISPGDPITVAAGDPISDVTPPGTVFINDAKKGKFTSKDSNGNITVAFDDTKLTITQPITANRVYKGPITIEDLEETQDPKFTKLPLDGVRLIISDPLGGSGNPKVEYLFNITSGSEIKINSTLLSVLKFINSVDGSVQTLKEEIVKQLTAVLVLLEKFVTDNASKPENLTKLKYLIPKQITNGELGRFKSIFEKGGLTLSDALEKAISDAQPEEKCVPPVKPDIPIELVVTRNAEGLTTISPAANTAGSLDLSDFFNQVGTKSEDPAKQDVEGDANATAAQPTAGQPQAAQVSPSTAAQPAAPAAQPAAQPPTGQETAGQVNAPQPPTGQKTAAPAAPATAAGAAAATPNTENLLKDPNTVRGAPTGGHRNISRKSKHKRNKQSKSTIRKNRK